MRIAVGANTPASFASKLSMRGRDSKISASRHTLECRIRPFRTDNCPATADNHSKTVWERISPDPGLSRSGKSSSYHKELFFDAIGFTLFPKYIFYIQHFDKHHGGSRKRGGKQKTEKAQSGAENDL